MLFAPANDVIPQIQARPPSDRASSRASSICTTTSPPWPPSSSAIPIPWYPAAVSLSQRSNGYSCSLRSASRAQSFGHSRSTHARVSRRKSSSSSGRSKLSSWAIVAPRIAGDGSADCRIASCSASSPKQRPSATSSTGRPPTSDGDAIVFPDERVTFPELAALSDRFARSLRGLGVGPHDKVGILMPNQLDFVAAVVGASKLGAIPVPINGRFKEHELSHVVAHADITVLLSAAGPEATVDYPALLAGVFPDAALQDPGSLRAGVGAAPARARASERRAPGLSLRVRRSTLLRRASARTRSGRCRHACGSATSRC